MKQTQDAFDEYMQMREQRDYARAIFFLALLVVSGAVLALSVWAGLRLAGRISKPVVSLVQATNLVSQGDLSVRLTPLDDDELGVLTQSFNRMAGQLKDKQSLLESKNRELDEKRKVTEAVFSGVRSGVLNLDENGIVALANSVAEEALHLTSGQSLLHVEQLEQMRRDVESDPQPVVERQIRIKLENEDKSLRVRMVPQMSTGGKVRSIVVTFDDVTELISAQKLSAWSDVARRIAHEIKNPLTPIQLSAERLQRRYTKTFTDESDKELFSQLTSTIIRQVGDMRNMVNEFSDFARMPAAQMQKESALPIIQDVIFLQREARPNINFEIDSSEISGELFVHGDRSQLSRVYTNIIENAVNAIEEWVGNSSKTAENKEEIDGSKISDEKVTNHEIKVVVELSHDGKIVTTVKDNGPGLPKDMDTDTLFDPYVTTRKKGTGLGLAIVKRVVDEHGGQIRLMRRTDTSGTCVEIILPQYKEVSNLA